MKLPLSAPRFVKGRGGTPERQEKLPSIASSQRCCGEGAGAPRMSQSVRTSRAPPLTRPSLLRAQPALWVKVVPLPPSAIDVDYVPLEFDGGVAFPASVHALKQAVIKSRPEMTGVTAAKLRVYHRGASEPTENADAAFIAAPHGQLPASSDLMDVINDLSLKAFFLLAAAGARAFCPRTSCL